MHAHVCVCVCVCVYIYIYIYSILYFNMFDISLFVPLKMAPVGAKSTWGKYSTFLNSFHLEVKQLK